MSPESFVNPSEYLDEVPSNIGDISNRAMKQEFKQMKQGVESSVSSEQQRRKEELDEEVRRLDELNTKITNLTNEISTISVRMRKLGESLMRGEFRKVETIIEKEEEYGKLRESVEQTNDALLRLKDERDTIAGKVEEATLALEQFQEISARLTAEAMATISEAEEMRRIGENFESFDRQQKRYARQLDQLRDDRYRNAESIARIALTSDLISKIIGDASLLTPEQIADLVEQNLEEIREAAMDESTRLVDRRELMGFWRAGESEGGLVGLVNTRRAMRDQEEKLMEMEAIARLEAEKALRILQKSFTRTDESQLVDTNSNAVTESLGPASLVLEKRSDEVVSAPEVVENVLTDVPEILEIPDVPDVPEPVANPESVPEGATEPAVLTNDGSESLEGMSVPQSDRQPVEANPRDAYLSQFPKRSESDAYDSTAEFASVDAINELAKMFGGLPDSQMRLELSRALSANFESISADQVGPMAQVIFNASQELGLKPNPGENPADFFARLDQALRRSNMSLAEKLREALPVVRIKFGKSEEEKAEQREAQRKEIQFRIDEIQEQLKTGDFPEAYQGNQGYRRELPEAEKQAVRRRLEAELAKLQAELAKLTESAVEPKPEAESAEDRRRRELEDEIRQLQVDIDTINTELYGLSGSDLAKKRQELRIPKEQLLAQRRQELARLNGETIVAPETETSGKSLGRRLLDRLNVRNWFRGRSEESNEPAPEANDLIREDHLNRIKILLEENANLSDLGSADTPQKRIVLNELVKIYISLADELAENGREHLSGEFAIPMVDNTGRLQRVQVESGDTAEEIRSVLTNLYTQSFGGLDKSKIIGEDNQFRQDFEQADRLLAS